MAAKAKSVLTIKQGAGGIVGVLRNMGTTEGIALHVAVRTPDGEIVPTNRWVWIAGYRLRDLAGALAQAADAFGGAA